MKDLEAINNLSQGTLMECLGIKITHFEKGYLKGTMPVDPRTFQPMRILHGGANVALAETLASFGAHAYLTDNQMAVGLEINANHLKAVSKGEVEGEAKIIHQGKTTQIWEIKIYNEARDLCCISRCTMMIR